MLFFGIEFCDDGRDFPEADLDYQAALYLRPENVADQAILDCAFLVSRFLHEAGVANEIGLQPAGRCRQIRETGDVAARRTDELGSVGRSVGQFNAVLTLYASKLAPSFLGMILYTHYEVQGMA